MTRLALALILLASSVQAGEFGDWLKEFYVPGTKTSCCLSDCRKLTTDQWRPGPDGYEVMLNGRFVPVPSDRVVRRPEGPDEAVLCATDHVYCFRPGIMS